MNAKQAEGDKLEELLRMVTPQDLLAALLWLARNECGQVIQWNGAVLRFLFNLQMEGLEEAPERIRTMVENFLLYENNGAVYSRELDPVLDRMHGNGFFSHPVDVRNWRYVRKGERELGLFDAEEQAYLKGLAERFRAQHPVAA